jgi:hypothetical protein
MTVSSQTVAVEAATRFRKNHYSRYLLLVNLSLFRGRACNKDAEFVFSRNFDENGRVYHG